MRFGNTVDALGLLVVGLVGFYAGFFAGASYMLLTARKVKLGRVRDSMAVIS